MNKDLITDTTFLSGNPEDDLLKLLGIPQHLVLNNINIFISIILLLCVLFTFGIFRYFTPFLLFLFVEITQRSYVLILNGGDNLLKFILLYMIFTDCYRYFALNKSENTFNGNSIKEFLNQLAVLSIKLHLCLIYFVAAVYKLNTKVWFSGIATYYTLQIERFEGTSVNKVFARNGTFVTFSTYLTLFWELFFPFLVWRKKAKYIMFALGIIIHLGIYIFMMIHDFEILFMMCYGFFISDEEWKKFYSYIQKAKYIFKTKYFPI